ncbi:MAG: Crp/Fnr family transcriptional regulator [Acidobacteriota bacterium]
MVVHLQSVDLFRYCSAEQMVRLASIAHQRRFRAGEPIYQAGDAPESLYCLIEGAVLLRREGEAGRTVAPQETFGVREILSDQPRRDDAVADADALALTLDAEDFFDLLSNNIEIVRSLFRQLLRPSPTADAAAHALR